MFFYALTEKSLSGSGLLDSAPLGESLLQTISLDSARHLSSITETFPRPSNRGDVDTRIFGQILLLCGVPDSRIVVKTDSPASVEVV